MKIVFETNFYGVVRVTNAFLPIVKKSKNPSILNVSSSLGSVTRHADPAAFIYKVTIPGYNVSKSALNAYSVNLAASVPEVCFPSHISKRFVSLSFRTKCKN